MSCSALTETPYVTCSLLHSTKEILISHGCCAPPLNTLDGYSGDVDSYTGQQQRCWLKQLAYAVACYAMLDSDIKASSLTFFLSAFFICAEVSDSAERKPFKAANNI